MASLTLYHGGGASGWSSGELAYPRTKTEKLFEACAKVLCNDAGALNLLNFGGFELRHGSNDFADEFFVLTKRVAIDEFLQLQDEANLSDNTASYTGVARAFQRLGIHVRFIGVELALEDDVAPVESPEVPKTLAPAVAAALSDAETLIESGNYLGAIDRVHTALHGYVRSLCVSGGFVTDSETVELTRAIKLLREKHPRLQFVGPHAAHVEKVLKAVGVICDAMGTLRNHGSLAHANEELLGPSEALLVANTARTILRYLIDKIDKGKS